MKQESNDFNRCSVKPMLGKGRLVAVCLVLLLGLTSMAVLGLFPAVHGSDETWTGTVQLTEDKILTGTDRLTIDGATVIFVQGPNWWQIKVRDSATLIVKNGADLDTIAQAGGFDVHVADVWALDSSSVTISNSKVGTIRAYDSSTVIINSGSEIHYLSAWTRENRAPDNTITTVYTASSVKPQIEDSIIHELHTSVYTSGVLTVTGTSFVGDYEICCVIAPSTTIVRTYYFLEATGNADVSIVNPPDDSHLGVWFEVKTKDLAQATIDHLDIDLSHEPPERAAGFASLQTTIKAFGSGQTVYAEDSNIRTGIQSTGEFVYVQDCWVGIVYYHNDDPTLWGKFQVGDSSFLGWVHLSAPSRTGHTMTAYGSARIDAAESKFGGASGLFEGNGYLSTADDADFAFGTGDFTIDFWFYHSSTPAAWSVLISKTTLGSWASGWALSYTSGWKFWAAYPSKVTSPPYVTSNNAWHHMAIVRSGSTITMYIDGTARGTVTQGASIDSSDALVIASQGGGYSCFNGWIDELRISKGIARWTSSFTPPTVPYGSDSTTVLLLHMDTDFSDDTGPDFTFDASPPSQTISAGEAAVYTLSLTAQPEYVGTVTLSLSPTTPCPVGAVCIFTPSDTVALFSSASVTFSVETATDGFTGPTSLSLSATDGKRTHTVTVELTVTPYLGPNFSIVASPPQSIGAGTAASYTLTIAATGGFAGVVALSVASGCPVGASCTVAPDSVAAFPATATLSVQTLITTAGGSYNIRVTGQGDSLTRTATATLVVVAPATFAFNMKQGATEIKVTVEYAWPGSGAPPLAMVTVAGPGGNPILQESGATVRDKTSITVSGATQICMVEHEATFTIAQTGSQQLWTVLLSLPSLTAYTVTVEVA